MIVKSYESLAGSKNETMLGNGRAVARRFLLAEDGVHQSQRDLQHVDVVKVQIGVLRSIETTVSRVGQGAVTKHVARPQAVLRGVVALMAPLYRRIDPVKPDQNLHEKKCGKGNINGPSISVPYCHVLAFSGPNTQTQPWMR